MVAAEHEKKKNYFFSPFFAPASENLVSRDVSLPSRPASQGTRYAPFQAAEPRTKHDEGISPLLPAVRLGGWSHPTIGGGVRGCHKFVPVLGEDGTKIALAGDQPPGDLIELNSELACRPCRGNMALRPRVDSFLLHPLLL